MKTYWFAEPKNDYTNEVLSRLRPGEDIQEIVVSLPQGKIYKTKAWSISFADLTYLERSRQSGLDYRAYAKEGSGRIRPHHFLLKKRAEKKRRTVLKKLAQELKQLTNK